jgi:DNA-binding transcriptional ArsR family regulator
MILKEGDVSFGEGHLRSLGRSHGWALLDLTVGDPLLILNCMVQSQALDRTLSALADPTRRSILEHLATGPASISELAEPIGISLPGVMKHVRILEDAKLVTTEKQGRIRECQLGPARMDEVTDWIEHHRRRWERRLDRLEAYVERRGGRTDES